MRDVHGEAQHVVPGLGQPVLQQRLGAARDLRLLEPLREARREVEPVAVRRQADRAGVRHAHRDAVEVDREPDLEALHQLAHGAREALPLDVRLGAGEQQERRAGGVVDELEQDLRRVVGRPAVAVKDHRRAARPVVDQPVVVETGHHLRRSRLQQVVHHLAAGLPGVHEALEVLEQHQAGTGVAQLRVGRGHRGHALLIQLVQRLEVTHRAPNPVLYSSRPTVFSSCPACRAPPEFPPRPTTPPTTASAPSGP